MKIIFLFLFFLFISSCKIPAMNDIRKARDCPEELKVTGNKTLLAINFYVGYSKAHYTTLVRCLQKCPQSVQRECAGDLYHVKKYRRILTLYSQYIYLTEFNHKCKQERLGQKKTLSKKGKALLKNAKKIHLKVSRLKSNLNSRRFNCRFFFD